MCLCASKRTSNSLKTFNGRVSSGLLGFLGVQLSADEAELVNMRASISSAFKVEMSRFGGTEVFGGIRGG